MEGEREAQDADADAQGDTLSDFLPVSDAEIETLQADPLYRHLNVRHVKAKFCRYHGRDPSCKVLRGWLTREKGEIDEREGTFASWLMNEREDPRNDDRGSPEQITRVARSLSRDN